MRQPSDRCLLLDLDGTLIDPALGIVGCLRAALEEVGHPAAEDDDLLWVIGPSLRGSLAKLVPDPAAAELALVAYRRRYGEEGLYQASVYDGVMEALELLQGQDARLFLCTAKAAVFARRIVERFGFDRFLEGVYGAELDGRFENKAELIFHILGQEGLSPEAACMVGDRRHDIEGARRNGVRGVGVLWGYGGEEELTLAGAHALISHPSEMTSILARV